MRIKRWMAVTGLVVTVAAVGGFFGFKAYAAKQAEAASAKAGGKDGKKADPTRALAAVDVATAGPATLLQTLSVAGTVDASKQAVLRSRHAGESGGLSGEPLRDLAHQRLRDFRSASGGAIALVGVGGIATADDAWARIRAGASLVQLYSAMVYEGPGLARRINAGLVRLMRRDGFSTIAEAVGSAP